MGENCRIDKHWRCGLVAYVWLCVCLSHLFDMLSILLCFVVFLSCMGILLALGQGPISVVCRSPTGKAREMSLGGRVGRPYAC